MWKKKKKKVYERRLPKLAIINKRGKVEKKSFHASCDAEH